jgi:hypothetical protein
MNDLHTFRLSLDEAEYFSKLNLRDQSFADLLRRHPNIRVNGRDVTADRAHAEILSSYFHERLARFGFDAEYMPNEEGVMLENLIDRFFLPRSD